MKSILCKGIMGSYSKSPSYEDGLEDPVVIVGLSFRFPSDAVSEESFWEILRDGHSTMTEVPASRYNINGHYSDASGRQHGVSLTDDVRYSNYVHETNSNRSLHEAVTSSRGTYRPLTPLSSK